MNVVAKHFKVKKQPYTRENEKSGIKIDDNDRNESTLWFFLHSYQTAYMKKIDITQEINTIYLWNVHYYEFLSERIYLLFISRAHELIHSHMIN